ncbi:response regulator transcription factor [Thalassotalea sp. HSM 43]|uniref:response regulator transcription factor n=1 Tax=Thalassotalea sp. HSM 43 TaxID=2552945 RepID=UPI001081B866|nr:response regulator transcription factor [Thalassotalea sp. HSM 43]QBY05282.1 response regulator transcription factor [Thalassotalea sp. HSM 43]
MSHQDEHILLIEDDIQLAKSIAQYLTMKGFTVTHFDRGDNLKCLISSGNVSLILCDVMLPGTSGFEIAETIRHEFDGPYLFLTALTDVESELKGFALGADDYIRKPVIPDLLYARINASLRLNKLKPKDNSVSIGQLQLHKKNRLVTYQGEPFKLSRYEFELLWLLVNKPGQTVSREYLFVNTVGREYDGFDRTVDGRVSRLRKKLQRISDNNLLIKSMWGRGYLLSVEGS